MEQPGFEPVLVSDAGNPWQQLNSLDHMPALLPVYLKSKMTYTEYKVRAVSVVIPCCVGKEDKKSLHMFSTDAHFKKRFFCPLLVKGDCEHGGLTACVEP